MIVSSAKVLLVYISHGHLEPQLQDFEYKHITPVFLTSKIRALMQNIIV